MGFFSLFKPKDRKKESNVKLGLALGGGGARGFAHLGALKAFEENGITFDFVAGTSVGSLVGALYANALTSEQIIDEAMKLNKRDIKTNRIAFMPSKTEGLQTIVKNILGDITFKDLKKPFCAVAVDIKSGKEVDIKQGNLAKAVAGSCAVPGVFSYVDFNEFRLMDGGLQNTIPSDVVKSMGADFVVAIDCNPNRGYGTESTKFVDILSASIRILMKSNAVKGRMFADVLIEPDTKRFKSTKLAGAEEMIMEGYNAALKKIPEIKTLLATKIKKQKQKYSNKND